MVGEMKLRLLGYYSNPNQVLYPERERMQEANELAPLLETTIDQLLINPDTDEEIKSVIKVPTVFIFKDGNGNLIAYYTRDKIARLTNVVFNKASIILVPPKYKAWFSPGEEIKLPVSQEVIDRVKTRLRLANCFFIGQFIPDQSGEWCKIIDIRNTDFTKIEDKERDVKNLTINFRCTTTTSFIRHAYYRFTWVLLGISPLKFGIDLKQDIIQVSPQDIVKCLHDSIVHYPASAAKKITGTLDTLNKQLTQSGKEVFIYELAQRFVYIE